MAPRNCDLTWVDASNGHIPTGAIQVKKNHHTNNGHLSMEAIRSFFNFSLYCCHHLQYVDKSLMFVFLKQIIFYSRVVSTKRTTRSTLAGLITRTAMLLERWYLCFFVYAMLLKICCWKGHIFVSLFAVGKVTSLFIEAGSRN